METKSPKLRFQEFRSAWQIKPLKDLVELTSGFAFKSEFFSESGNRLVIPKNFTKSGYGCFSKETTKFTVENPGEKYRCSEGDLLVLLTDLTPSCELLGKPLLISKHDGEVWLNQRIIKLTTTEEIEKRFLLNFFLTESYHKIIKETATGSTVRHSSNKIILDLKIPLPSLVEQQKISSFLTAIDDKIQQLNRKKALLEKYKKGVSQKIFSQEIRFKDEQGSEYPSWTYKKLGEVCISIKSGKSKPGESGEFAVYGSTGILGLSHSYTHDGLYILIARVGANAGLLKLVSGKFGVTDNTLVLELSGNNNVVFFYYLLTEVNLNRLIFGSGQPLITGGHLKLLNINLPSSSEQKKIADFLTALDNKLNLVAIEIEKAQAFKKGLLQQMFI